MPDVVDRLNAALEGRYRVERELGDGGLATVYEAHDVRDVKPGNILFDADDGG